MDNIQFGSVSKAHKLDKEGSTLRTTTYKKGVSIAPMVATEYTIRHRVTSSEEEKKVLSLNQKRQDAHKLFNVSIKYESKHKLPQNGYYYMVEHFTIYRNWQEQPHVKAFVDQERREFML